MNSRAAQIIAELDNLTQELSFLSTSQRSANVVTHIRTTMGFEKGGYVGETSLSDLEEGGEFTDQDEDEDDEDEEE